MRWFWIGVVLAVAYCIRGEALVFLALVGLISFIRFLSAMAKRTPAIWPPRSGLGLACLFMGFSTLALPYVIFLRVETGRWQVSGKTMEALVAYDIDRTGSPVNYEQARMGLDQDGQHLRIELERNQSALDFLWRSRFRQLRKYMQNISKAYIQELPRVVPPVFLALLAIGLYVSFQTRADLVREGYFGLWFMIPFLFYPVFLVETRYFLPIVPLAVLWVSRGLTAIFRGLVGASGEGKMARMGSNVWVFSGVLVALSLCHQVPLAGLLRADPWTFPLEHRAAGEWLRHYARPHPRVMNRKSFVSFYAGGIPYVTPYGSFDSIINYARAHEIEYFVVDERYTIPVRPQLKFLLGRAATQPGLRNIYEDDGKEDARITIFELLPESGTDSAGENNARTPERR